MYKKGQLGHFLTGVAAFILIFLMTGIFITYYFLTSGNKESAFEQARYYHKDDLMLQQVVLDGKTILVYDLIIRKANNLILTFKFEEAIKGIVNKDNPCAIIEITDGKAAESYLYKYQGDSKPILIDAVVRNVDMSSSLLFDYKEKGIAQKIKFNYHNDPSQVHYIYYYYGKCLRRKMNILINKRGYCVTLGLLL